MTKSNGDRPDNRPVSLEHLSEIEREIAGLMARGYSQAVIAAQTGLGRNRVRYTEHKIKATLHTTSRNDSIGALADLLGLEIPERKMRCRICHDVYPVSRFPNHGSNICETCRDRHMQPRINTLLARGRRVHGRIIRYSQEIP